MGDGVAGVGRWGDVWLGEMRHVVLKEMENSAVQDMGLAGYDGGKKAVCCFFDSSNG